VLPRDISIEKHSQTAPTALFNVELRSLGISPVCYSKERPLVGFYHKEQGIIAEHAQIGGEAFSPPLYTIHMSFSNCFISLHSTWTMAQRNVATHSCVLVLSFLILELFLPAVLCFPLGKSPRSVLQVTKHLESYPFSFPGTTVWELIAMSQPIMEYLRSGQGDSKSFEMSRTTEQ